MIRSGIGKQAMSSETLQKGYGIFLEIKRGSLATCFDNKPQTALCVIFQAMGPISISCQPEENSKP